MITIRSFSSQAQASLARSVLETAGIAVSLADEHTYSLGAQYVPDGIRLQVPPEEEEKARRILDNQELVAPLPDDFVPPEPYPENLATPETGPFTWTKAFFLGGMFATIALALIILIGLLLGGSVSLSVGFVLLVFAVGGVLGIVVHSAFGPNEGKKKAPGKSPRDGDQHSSTP
ncbi:DUF2007 domain-containing protein [Pelagicoccus sp. SDUM812003]|uniref:putative signal transducing protein n=1 Tax=Pelagicoccus sp. SDUM812003 TaxID=3041267 RepID=UPI00280C499D|nr:DUF2007 domain-containing protein [Pelagicoccus sp. SDUM812003]MDQ8202806.1 DUF2007 domain-containing protein [Pelagicoccus sp. SDUM812003]